MERLIDTDGARIAYTVEGRAQGSALVFLNSIGSTRAMWGPQVGRFAASHRVVTCDARGHGESSVPPGDYTIAQLGRDVLAILDAEGFASAHVCGLSLGGITALWLAVHAPERVRTLTLANTAARIGSVESWTERIALVRSSGMTGVAGMAIPRWFTPRFRAAVPATVEVFRHMIEACPPAGYLGCCAALRDEDLRAAVPQLRCPVLCIAGAEDVATPPEALQDVHAKVAGSTLVTLDAAHISNIEQVDAFNAALGRFLESQG